MDLASLFEAVESYKKVNKAAIVKISDAAEIIHEKMREADVLEMEMGMWRLTRYTLKSNVGSAECLSIHVNDCDRGDLMSVEKSGTSKYLHGDFNTLHTTATAAQRLKFAESLGDIVNRLTEKVNQKSAERKVAVKRVKTAMEG